MAILWVCWHSEIKRQVPKSHPTGPTMHMPPGRVVGIVQEYWESNVQYYGKSCGKVVHKNSGIDMGKYGAKVWQELWGSSVQE